MSIFQDHISLLANELGMDGSIAPSRMISEAAIKEIKSLRASLSAAEKERNDLLKEQVAWRKFTDEANATVDKALAERDTALRERDELREEIKILQGELSVKCADCNYKEAFERETELRDILTSIKTALNCPSLPNEELAGKVGEVAADAAIMRENFTYFRYSHDEIEITCGGEVALDVREKVMARRARIDAEASIHPKEGE